jgi:hypothetical protein
MPLVDFESNRPSAVALGGIGHGLARASVVAATIFKPFTFKAPLSIGHYRVPQISCKF